MGLIGKLVDYGAHIGDIRFAGVLMTIDTT